MQKCFFLIFDTQSTIKRVEIYQVAELPAFIVVKSAFYKIFDVQAVTKISEFIY